MKKITFAILSIIIGFFGFTFADLEFTNYQLLGQIQNDGTINVQENIAVNFRDKMHGIERKIPRSYVVQDTEFQVFVEDIDVPDHEYTILDDYYGTNIRIGDPDIYVEGNENYEIDYSIYGLIRNFSGMGYAELYRNVIGYERSNSIQNVQIELTLPKAYTGLTKDDFLISAGYSDKTSIDDFDGEVSRDENKIYITYNKKLDSYNGITLAIRFPNDYFDFDHEMQESLLVGYTHDFNIKNYKLYGNVEKSGNILFQNEIELEILNEEPLIWATLPYRYQADGQSFLTQLRDVKINGVEKDIDLYDTTNLVSTFRISNEFDTISGNYSVYGLIRPFSGDFEDRAYRMYIPLPALSMFENVENIELTLDIPGGCDTVYSEDISVNVYGKIIGLDEYNEKYGNIRCRNDKVMMVFSGELDYSDELGLYINFVKGTFDLDEQLLKGLAALADGQFYYTDKTNWQSILLAIGILLFGGGFKALMKKRYKNQAMVDNKYPIQYDAPKGVDAPEAGVLVDNKIDPKDLTSLIYQWAINRYIKIFVDEENPKKFYIKKLNQIPGTSKKYQLDLFNSLFENGDEFHFDSQSTKFSDALSTANKQLKSYINKEKWFKNSFYSGIGSSFKRQSASLVFRVAVLGFIPYFAILTWINNSLIPVSNRVKIVLFVAFVLIVSSYRNYKQETNTEKGKEIRNHCLGFKDFLIKVDKEKLETLMKQDPLYLEKVLPYAIVFGIHSQFIKNITPEMIQDWDWFEGDLSEFEDTIRRMNSYYTINFMPILRSYGSGSSTSYSHSGGFSSGSSFGGGFSSGGGGGGGGGGGW